MKLLEKEKARVLRKKGHSINQIVKEMKFSKASVSLWVRDIVLTKQQKKMLSERGRSTESVEKRRINRLFNENARRQKIIDEAKKDFYDISLEQLKLIGVILYLGEGAKTPRGMARLSNSDPLIIKIMMRFFREICDVPEHKFRGHIHTFAHVDINKTEMYWSKITGIPRGQFFKTYIKPSSASLQKRNTLPFGTFDVCICDTKLFLTIKGWIEKVKELAVSLAAKETSLKEEKQKREALAEEVKTIGSELSQLKAKIMELEKQRQRKMGDLMVMDRKISNDENEDRRMKTDLENLKRQLDQTLKKR